MIHNLHSGFLFWMEEGGESFLDELGRGGEGKESRRTHRFLFPVPASRQSKIQPVDPESNG